MKKIALTISIILSMGMLQAEELPKKEEGIKYIKMLGSSLKSALQQELKADPSGLKALEFCSKKAKEITKEVDLKLPKYATIRRTALRVRSQDNTPDSIDQGVMEVFNKAALEKKLSNKDIIAIDINKTTRVYKPLLIKKVCTKCHGTNVSDELQKKIKELYPDDKALGYKEGDFRGVIVAEIKDK